MVVKIKKQVPSYPHLDYIISYTILSLIILPVNIIFFSFYFTQIKELFFYTVNKQQQYNSITEWFTALFNSFSLLQSTLLYSVEFV